MRDLTITFKEERLEKEIEELAKKLGKDVSIPGFRKGKAPIPLIKARFGEQLKAESLQKLIQDKMKDIIMEYEPFIYGPPMIKNLDENDKEIRLDVTLDVPPEVNLDVSKIKLNSETEGKTEISEELEKLREINSELRPTDRKIKRGDIVFLNIRSGEEEVSNYSWEVGDDKFSGELIGLKTDEEKEIEINLPENFPIKEVASKKKPVTFKIAETKEKVKPALDDEFAKDLGFKNLEELKENLKKNVKEEREKKEKEGLKGEVIKKALEVADDFEVSSTLIEQRSKRGLDEEEAKIDAKKATLLDSIALKEKMTVEDNELDEWMERIADSEEEQFEELGEEAIRFIKRLILREKTLDFLIEGAKEEGSNE